MKFVFVDPPFIDETTVSKVGEIELISDVVVYDESPANLDEVIHRIIDADLLSADIYVSFDRDILKHAKRLKAVFTQAVGFDNFDIEYLRSRDIPVYNCAGFNANAVGEYVFTALGALNRKLCVAQLHVKIGGWEYIPFLGRELSGLTIGILGSGHVAQAIATIAKGYGMNVIAWTRNPTVEKARRLGIEDFSCKEDVLCNADVLCTAVPLTSETYHIVGRNELSLLKRDSVVVNVSRATVVDEIALAEFLIAGRIRGAVLDVIWSEPFDVKSEDLILQELVNLPNVIVTPHIAGVTVESRRRLGEVFLENVEGFLVGDRKRCVNC